jgi:hypothetical protein
MEICGNGIDDDCNGEVDESCPVCTNGIMDGDEEGVDCGGSCTNKCVEIPWLLIAIIGAVGLVVVFLYEFLKKMRGKKEEKWEELENRYIGR